METPDIDHGKKKILVAIIAITGSFIITPLVAFWLSPFNADARATKLPAAPNAQSDQPAAEPEDETAADAATASIHRPAAAARLAVKPAEETPVDDPAADNADSDSGADAGQGGGSTGSTGSTGDTAAADASNNASGPNNADGSGASAAAGAINAAQEAGTEALGNALQGFWVLAWGKVWPTIKNTLTAVWTAIKNFFSDILSQAGNSGTNAEINAAPDINAANAPVNATP